MKVLFAGPSIYGCKPDLSSIELRPPAAQGDVTKAVLEGTSAIGLVDGQFETIAAVWHKEILFALSKGVHVLGAASMGALRAAECHQFGMMPIGEIAARYISGELDDDAAVAQVHAPAELGFAPLTETLVDADATIKHLGDTEEITEEEEVELLEAARAIFFKDRTVERIVSTASNIGSSRGITIVDSYLKAHSSPKKRDALALVDSLRSPSYAKKIETSWAFAETAIWTRLLNSKIAELSEN